MNPRNFYQASLETYLAILMFLLFPSLGVAGVVSLAPGYSANEFTTLNFNSRAIAFDAALNLYAMDIADDSSGSVNIYVLNQSDGYSTRSLYTSYSTGACCTNGLFFNSSETQLIVSEAFSSGDTGLIRELDTTTLSTTANWYLPDFRPTGVAVDGAGTIFFPGRLYSAPNFGNLYRLDASGTPEIVLNGLVGTGVTIDAAGDIYVSTPKPSVTSSFNANSIYKIDPITFGSTLVATFDDRIDELASDSSGNIYALDNLASPNPIIWQISKVPLPASVWLFGSGLIGLISVARRKKS